MIMQWYTYGTIAATTCITALGVGIGQAIASSGALEAINRQPSAESEITKTAILGTALVETAAVLATAIAIWIFAELNAEAIDFYASLARVGVLIAMGIPGFVVGIAAGYPTKHACLSIARQPFFSGNIANLLLITLSMVQTPVIFGFLVSFFIKNQAFNATSLVQSLQLIASGIAIGVGSIGPALGLTHFATRACQSVGINKTIFNKLRLFALVSQALVETPIIFALIIALFIMIKPITPASPSIAGIMLLCAASCIGIGTLTPSICSARTAGTAAQQISYYPELYAEYAKLSLLGQIFIDTCALYPLVVAILLIIFTPT